MQQGKYSVESHQEHFCQFQYPIECWLDSGNTNSRDTRFGDAPTRPSHASLPQYRFEVLQRFFSRSAASTYSRRTCSAQARILVFLRVRLEIAGDCYLGCDLTSSSFGTVQSLMRGSVIAFYRARWPTYDTFRSRQTLARETRIHPTHAHTPSASQESRGRERALATTFSSTAVRTAESCLFGRPRCPLFSTLPMPAPLERSIRLPAPLAARGTIYSTARARASRPTTWSRHSSILPYSLAPPSPLLRAQRARQSVPTACAAFIASSRALCVSSKHHSARP
ncbi:hypothetical protein B0H14DRAFT_3629291 [Mycena olivaceomarginata]|nr:hypothetical protein B0H14DRAFT_3629291 [Mycena olivaceomarginata]